MSKIIKVALIAIMIIITNIALLSNTVQAIENGEQIKIYTKGYFNRIIRNNGIVIKTAHAVYQENDKEYPVYCLNRELHGVGDYIATYDVSNQGKVEDLGLWRVIINGYPYKTPEQLGTINEEEAYTATKQAIYCYIYNTGTELYSAIGEAGNRVINAMNIILENAKKCEETFQNPNIDIVKDEKWKVDNIECEYISKQYEIKSNKNTSKIILNLEKQPEGTKITNIENQEKNEFKSDEKFKILIPIKSLSKNGEFKVKIKTEMETKPIFFGKAPNGDLQDYALTAFSYEDVETEFMQEYEKNDTKIIIEKKDNETKELLKGAKFEILDENKNVIKIDQTNDNGQIVFEKIMPGKYYIKEIEAPNGYTLNSELKEMNIKMNEEVLVEVDNLKIKVKIPEQPKEVEKTEIPKLPVTGM